MLNIHSYGVTLVNLQQNYRHSICNIIKLLMLNETLSWLLCTTHDQSHWTGMSQFHRSRDKMNSCNTVSGSA